MTSPEIAQATVSDVHAITELYEGPDFSSDYYDFVERCVKDYPSAISYSGGDCTGFAYAKQFAPDIVELDNLYVAPAHRNRGLGTALLRYFEQAAAGTYASVILINSSLYPRPELKKSAAAFYTRNGYTLSFATAHSNVFTKVLDV